MLDGIRFVFTDTAVNFPHMVWGVGSFDLYAFSGIFRVLITVAK